MTYRYDAMKAAVDEGYRRHRDAPAMPSQGAALEESRRSEFTRHHQFDCSCDVSAAHSTAMTNNSRTANSCTAVYQEELCGYMAGYAAVKLGYTKLGFLGGMAVPRCRCRYGYGFVQGADAAAAEEQAPRSR